MSNEIDLRDVVYFEAIIDHGQLTRAARTLGVAQPTLSHAVRRLEEAIREPLWHRRKNRRLPVEPTEAGALVLRRARAAKAELDRLAEELASLRRVDRGRLRVGALPSLCSTWLPHQIARFHRAHPGVDLLLRSVSSRHAALALREGELDVAITAGPPTTDPDLDQRALFTQPFVVVLPKRHSHAKHTDADSAIPLKELRDEDWVLVPEGTFGTAPMRSAFNRAGFSPREVCSLASVEGLLTLVREGLGITLLPAGHVPPRDRQLVERRVCRPSPRRKVWLTWHGEREWSAATDAFAELVVRS